MRIKIFNIPITDNGNFEQEMNNLLSKHKIDSEILEKAITNTFALRETTASKEHALFIENFKTDPKRLQMWKFFLKKINHKNDLAFQTVMQTITEQLKPMLTEN